MGSSLQTFFVENDTFVDIPAPAPIHILHLKYIFEAIQPDDETTYLKIVRKCSTSDIVSSLTDTTTAPMFSSIA